MADATDFGAFDQQIPPTDRNRIASMPGPDGFNGDSEIERERGEIRPEAEQRAETGDALPRGHSDRSITSRVAQSVPLANEAQEQMPPTMSKSYREAMKSRHHDGRAADRLAAARLAAGFASAAAFAREAGVNKVTYQHHESGYRPIPPSKARIYSNVLKIDVAALVSGIAPRPLSGFAEILIIGAIRGGGDIVPYARKQQRSITMPGAVDGMVAHEVLDDSLFPAYRIGDIVSHEPLDARCLDLTAIDGVECVCRLKTGATLLRQVIVESRAKGTVTLIAYQRAPMTRVKLVAASPVKIVQRNIRPRRSVMPPEQTDAAA